MAQYNIVAGIDVGKAWLDVALSDGKRTQRVANTPDGHAALAQWLTAHGVTRIGLEASGGYERAVLDALEALDFEVKCFNAWRIRHFAKAHGRLAKNDLADAKLIAMATLTLVAEPPDKRRRELDPLVEHLSYRSELKTLIDRCTSQLEVLKDKTFREQTRRRKAALELQVARIDRALAALIAGRDDWSSLARRLRTVPGVGPVTAATMIALLPELGALSNRAIASLVGVAPFDHDSGKHKGERHIQGGRATVRKALYMAAFNAMTRNPRIAAFAARLAGKKRKVAMVACMRKLLCMLNAMVRSGADWNGGHGQTKPA